MISAVLISIFLSIYIHGALKRHNSSECMYATSHNKMYRAEKCEISADGNITHFIGRVYSTKTGSLLAELEFDSPSYTKPEFQYDDSVVLFDSGGDNTIIYLPPSLLDRIRAKLP